MAGKNILLISSEFPPNAGGIGNHGHNLAKALQNEGYNVTVLADIIDVADDVQKEFSAKQAFRIRYIKRHAFVARTYVQRFVFSIRLSRSADHIICSGKYPLWMGAMIRIVYPSKWLMAVVHGSELDLRSPSAKKLVNRSLRSFNTIIAVSAYTKRYLPKELPAHIQQHVIHNGIDIHEFDGIQNEQLNGDPALITIGSLTERKGQMNVIRALPLIRRSFPNVRYHIVGKPVIKKEIDAIASELGVDDAVEINGALDRKTLLQTLAGANIKLMLSNHTADGDFEGFGIAVLEANALGIPVIGTRNSGIADAVADGKTGVLVDPENADEIVDAIESIRNNYSAFSMQARVWAQQHDWKLIVKQYTHALQN